MRANSELSKLYIETIRYMCMLQIYVDKCVFQYVWVYIKNGFVRIFIDCYVPNNL